VPDEQQLTAVKYDLWCKNPYTFWTVRSFTFIPPETCREPLRFVYAGTVQQEADSHEDCLRRRYLALFWFDYFKMRYPMQERGYDHEYCGGENNSWPEI
jgi:hypothetical protein